MGCSDEMHRAAMEYVRVGLHLIPLIGKKPARQLLPLVDGQPSWRSLLDRRNLEDEIQRWFAAGGVNIGLLTGASGLVAIDCDGLPETAWWQEHRPCTPLMSRTARGCHFFYRLDRNEAAFTNRAGVLGRKIDLRAYGGYVVVPPSRHPSGMQYQWVHRFCVDGIPAFDPAWIESPVPARRPRSVPPSGDERLRRYILRIQSISGEHGHAACFRCACKIADAGVGFDAGMEMLREWNGVCARPAWSESELRHKLLDAFNRR